MENCRSIAKKPRLDDDECNSADEMQQDFSNSSRYHRHDRQKHRREDIKSPCHQRRENGTMQQRRDVINQTPDQQKCERDVSKSARCYRSSGRKYQQHRNALFRRSESGLGYNNSGRSEGTRNHQHKRKRSPSPCDCSALTSSFDESVPSSGYNFQKVITDANVPFVDSHCHLDLLFKRSDFHGSMRDFMKQYSFPKNYLGCVAVFCYPHTWRKLLNKESHMASVLKEPNVWAAIGCHPKSAADFTSSAENDLKKLLRNEKVKALGEIGLDYSGRFGWHHKLQKKVLIRQVAIALDLNLPLVIHARDAERDICEILGKLVPKDYKIHRHCFTGNWMAAKAWLEMFPSSYIGLTAAVTYPRNDSLREVARCIPLDKLLLETDAPYFLPAQMSRSEKLSHPGMAIAVAAEVAAIRGIHLDDVLAACITNTRAMYNL